MAPTLCYEEHEEGNDNMILAGDSNDTTNNNNQHQHQHQHQHQQHNQQQQQQQQHRPYISNTRSSSFFLLNQQSNKSKSIPQLTVTLQNVTYRPMTVLSSSSSSFSATIGWNRLGRGTKSWTRRKRLLQHNTIIDTHHDNRTVVLNQVCTEIKPFELTAWMGPSGSGKTSLTSVVAGLVSSNDVEGSIRVHISKKTTKTKKNVHVKNKDTTATTTVTTTTDILNSIPKQMVGVVWQDDLLLSNLTVEETIYFAARLKTSRTVTDTHVRMLVEETMKELGVFHRRSHLISNISGGEQKRTSVALELVCRPSLLLCDEPTSGLDATTACSLMQTFKDLTSLGHSIAVVIHQPRTDIFNMIDHLLLLSKGNVVFDGNAKNVRTYLENLPPPILKLPKETGIADWVLDTIIADEQYQSNTRKRQGVPPDDNENKNNAMFEGDNSRSSSSSSSNNNINIKNDIYSNDDDNIYVSLADHWIRLRCPEQKATEDEGLHEAATLRVSDVPSTGYDHDYGNTTTTTTSVYEASCWHELVMLTQRISKQQRGEKLTQVSFLLTLTYLIFTSFIYWQLPDNTDTIFERNSLIFFMLIAQANGIVSSSIAVFNRERALLRRERAKKMYRVLPFFIAKGISDMTNNIALPLLYAGITYWTAGLRPSLIPFLKFLLGYYLSLSCAQSMGFFLSVLCPSMQIAMMIAPSLILFMFILGGFYIPISNMHIAMKYVSYFSFGLYGYSALIVNEYKGRVIPCATTSNTTNEANDAEKLNECPLQGDAVYESMGIQGVFGKFWFNIGMLALFQTLFLVGAYVLLRRSKPK